MMMAILATLLLWLPYVCTLIAVPCLKRKSHLKCLQWINLWKPFYDAYYGPLKDRHHYWIGLLLIIRGGLLLLFLIASTSYPNMTIFIMILTSTLILLYTSFVENVYKNRFLGLSENFALANLIFLGSSTLYVNLPKSVIVQISIALAFGQFVCTVVFHIWQKLKARWLRETDSSSTSETQYQHRERQDTWSGSLNQHCESLLEDSV